MVSRVVTMSRQTDRTRFSAAERRGVCRALYERRDIRSHFLPKPIPARVLGRVLDAAHHGPSVGFMQPWDFIVICDPAVRQSVHESFVEANRRVTCDRLRRKGAGLGRQTDPATDLYSTVCAIRNLWLAARAESLGVGWVSILEFDRLREILAIPAEIVPVAYLCMGYVSEFPARPDLGAAGWESRERLSRLIHFDTWGAHDDERAAELLAGTHRNGASR